MSLFVCSSLTRLSVMTGIQKDAITTCSIMRLHGDLEHINYVVVCVCMCLDGTARRTPVRFSRAHPSIGAQAEGSGFPEKHQCTGPSPAYSARLAPAINQPSHSTAHTAEGASRGLRHRHNTHPHFHSYLFLCTPSCVQ